MLPRQTRYAVPCRARFLKTAFGLENTEASIKTLVNRFIDVVGAALHSLLPQWSDGQIMVVMLWLAVLKKHGARWNKVSAVERPWTKWIRFFDNERLPDFVPGSDIQSPEIPYFVTEASGAAAHASARAMITAPRHCWLCGKGFLDFGDLDRHCRE